MRSMRPRSSVARCLLARRRTAGAGGSRGRPRPARRRGSDRRPAPRASVRRSATSWLRSSSRDSVCASRVTSVARRAQLGLALGQRRLPLLQRALPLAVGPRPRLGLGLPSSASSRSRDGVERAASRPRAVVVGQRRLDARGARLLVGAVGAQPLQRLRARSAAAPPPAWPPPSASSARPTATSTSSASATRARAQLARARLGLLAARPVVLQRRSRPLPARARSSSAARLRSTRWRRQLLAPRLQAAPLLGPRRSRSFSCAEQRHLVGAQRRRRLLERARQLGGRLLAWPRAGPAPPRRRRRGAPSPPRARGSRASAPARRPAPTRATRR